MAEEVVATETETTEGGSWLDEHENLSDEDKKLFSRYKSRDDALTGAAETMRKVGKSVHWPDDKTSDKDRATFDAKVHDYQGVPKTPKDYKIDRSGIPDNIEYDEEMEANFREWAHASKAPQSVVEKFVAGYSATMLGRHKAVEDVAKAAEEELMKEWGADFDVKLGKKDDDESIGVIKERLLQLSAELKLDYKDDKENPRSRLVDELEFLGKNGALGNRVAVIKALDNLLEFKYAEGTTVIGSPVNKGKGGGGEFGTKEFYEHVDGEDE